MFSEIEGKEYLLLGLELGAEILVALVVFLGLGRFFSHRWRQLNERAHSRMLDVVDFTQTIIEDGVLKIRTVKPTTIHDFTLRAEQLTRIFGTAVQTSYDQDHPYVVVPEKHSKGFKKLETIIYSHANTALNQDASWERFKPLESRVSTVTVKGRLVVYAEKDAQVSKVHVEFVPDSLWNELREPPVGSDDSWQDYHGVLPERGRTHLLIRLKTLWEIKQAAQRHERAGAQGHLLVFPFDAEMLDHRSALSELLSELRQTHQAKAE